MKYAIVSREDDFSNQLIERIKNKIKYEYDEKSPDFIISVGGDGTILRAVHKYMDRIDKIVFFGINTGHLGFFTNFELKEIDDLISAVNSRNFYTEEYSMLEYSYNGITDYALNEVTLMSNYVQEVDVLADGKMLENFRGTGLCISTPCGSTAYNKSLGGPIVDPKMDAVILTEIASINSNAYRTLGASLVVSSERELTLISKQNAYLTADQFHNEIKPSTIKVKLSNKTVKFGKIHDISFWDRVKKSFI